DERRDVYHRQQECVTPGSVESAELDADEVDAEAEQRIAQAMREAHQQQAVDRKRPQGKSATAIAEDPPRRQRDRVQRHQSALDERRRRHHAQRDARAEKREQRKEQEQLPERLQPIAGYHRGHGTWPRRWWSQSDAHGGGGLALQYRFRLAVCEAIPQRRTSRDSSAGERPSLAWDARMRGDAAGER